MHDIDRTVAELEPEIDALEAEAFDFEFEPEGEIFGDTEAESVFDEVEEMELAADLLEITDEAELDQFLGNLIQRASRAAGKFMRSGAGRALGGVLKNAARKALPIVGGALGNVIAPGIGGVVGGNLASAAGRMFGLELEGLSPEDREFEVARRFVRFSGDAAKNVALTPPSVPPQAAAKAGVAAAARKYAPGLAQAARPGAAGVGAATGRTSERTSANGRGGMGARPGAAAPESSRTGRWIRRGHRVVLLGV